MLYLSWLFMLFLLQLVVFIKYKVISWQTIRYSEYSLICEAYWLWSAKLDMTPLGVGQHFCLGLVKFMELVHQIHLAEEGPTQREKTVKISVMLTRHAGAVVTSTNFWPLFTLQCQCCVDLFWWLAKLRAYVNDNWSIPASTCRETGPQLELQCIPVYQPQTSALNWKSNTRLWSSRFCD